MTKNKYDEILLILTIFIVLVVTIFFIDMWGLVPSLPIFSKFPFMIYVLAAMFVAFIVVGILKMVGE